MAFKESSDRRVRYGRILGLLFLVVGFTVIALAWNGSANRACVDCQFPYLISGGVSGLGLIVLGSALLLVSGQRAERLHLQHVLEEGFRSFGRASTASAATAATSPNGQVVIGKATYHRPDCRLVRGKTDLELVSVEQASASGLSACRVCQPAAPDQTSAAH